MPSIQGLARAGTLLVCGAAFATLPGLAAAESYVRGSYDTGSSKNKDSSGTTDNFKNTDYGLDIRYDLLGTPLFATAGGIQVEAKLKDIDPDSVKFKATGYNLGAGMVVFGNRTTEAYTRLAYSHVRVKVEVADITGASTFCCGTSDSGTLAVGGHDWVHKFVKVYGEAEFTKSSHHAHHYGATVGFEFPVIDELRLFVEGTYMQGSAYDTDSTSSTVGAGIKYAWGGKPKPMKKKKAAAPVAQAAEAAPTEAPAEAPAAEAAPAEATPAVSEAPATTPVAAPAAPAEPTPVAADPAAGSTAKLNDGVKFRAQPKAAAAAMDTDASEAVTLKTQIVNTDGKWWYVSNSKGAGWVKQSELAPQ